MASELPDDGCDVCGRSEYDGCDMMTHAAYAAMRRDWEREHYDLADKEGGA